MSPAGAGRTPARARPASCARRRAGRGRSRRVQREPASNSAEEQQQRPVDLRMPDRMKRTNVGAPGDEPRLRRRQAARARNPPSAARRPAARKQAAGTTSCAARPRILGSVFERWARRTASRVSGRTRAAHPTAPGGWRTGCRRARNFVMACSMITSMSPRYGSGGALKTAGNSLIATEASSTIPIAATTTPRHRCRRATAMGSGAGHVAVSIAGTDRQQQCADGKGAATTGHGRERAEQHRHPDADANQHRAQDP